AGQRPHRGADLVGLAPDVAVLEDLHVEPRRQRVHHGDADAVQATGDRVGLAVELAARVQRGEHDLHRRPLLHRVVVHRDATAIVGYPHATVGEQGNVDLVAEAGQGLVNRVVNHLLHKVVQAALASGTDVHPWTFTDCFQAFEDRDRACVVGQVQAPPGRGAPATTQ